MTDSEDSKWKDALDSELEATDKKDLVIPYEQVVKAFPSSTPHPRSFDYPMIDDISLRQWALERGWQADLAPESLPENSSALPPVRFYRNDGVGPR
ncbi:hypothetical protein [Thioalkalivibrio sp. ALJT]|uniref:hypothetical protein n=1 Tax=Thioalkalivibrio sp. ALJT TaxID=1158146 RepID=UPI0012DC81E8|nr:hypothetical protein [Thioalkalivibrio sp. ALJT]